MKLLHDTWLIFGRSLSIAIRNPVWVLIGLSQPILYLALFGPLLAPMTALQGFPAGDWTNVFVPGLLLQITIFSAFFAGFGLLAELRSGVLERMRVASAQGREAGLAEGVQIAREMLAAVRGRVQGAQIAAPLGRVPVALDVLGAR